MLKNNRDNIAETKLYITIMVSVFFITALTLVHAERTDIVQLKNGDTITGEIKKLQYGILTFKTDDAGTINIEWDHVDQLISTDRFEVELINGKIYFGSLVATPSNITIGIARDSATVFAFYNSTIVKVTPIKDLFWSRFSGSVGAGFNYTKASKVGKLNINFDVNYRSREYINSLEFSSNFTSQESKSTTSRYDLNLNIGRILSNKLYLQWLIAMQHNSELGLDVRLIGGGGLRKFFVQNNQTNLAALAGITLNREWPGTENTKINLEGVIAIAFKQFNYSSPKTDITAGLTIFPSLTTWGRVRSEFNASIKHELISDFTVNTDGYFSHDSKPSNAAASKSDWGITFGVGYSFN